MNEKTLAHSSSIPLIETEIRNFPIVQEELMGKTECKRITKNIEVQLNQIWYHLYRIMRDIRLRHTSLFDSQAMAKVEILTEYTKRALQFIQKNRQYNMQTADPLDYQRKIIEMENDEALIDNHLKEIWFLNDDARYYIKHK